jgi:hypothetical protein
MWGEFLQGEEVQLSVPLKRKQKAEPLMVHAPWVPAMIIGFPFEREVREQYFGTWPVVPHRKHLGDWVCCPYREELDEAWGG